MAYVWGLFKQNVGLNQLIQPGRILCWAAKWYKEKGIYFAAEWSEYRQVDGNAMIPQLHALLSEADAVVTYNGNKFDLPKIHGEVLALGLPPIPPSPSIDLYTTCRRLGYPSGKLAYVARHLGLGAKGQTAGFDTWVGAMEGIESDQRVMERYNKQDVRLLERLYTKLRPYIKTHPYLGDAEQGGANCPACGSKHVQKRGFLRSRTLLTQRLNCQGCGHWFKGTAKKIIRVGKQKEEQEGV